MFARQWVGVLLKSGIQCGPVFVVQCQFCRRQNNAFFEVHVF
jgi:hypothetical protein